MKNSIQGLFATPVYFSKIDNVDELKDEFNTVMNDFHFYETPEMWGMPHKITTLNFEDNIIEKHNMMKIKRVIDDNLKLFLDSVKVPNYPYFMTAWISSYDKGEYAPVHNHLNADLSGVYYYETNQSDGNIFFVTPSLVMTSSIFHKLSDNFHVTPEEGKLLIFPGWLQHGVTTNTTAHNRKSLAFNIYFKR